MPLTLPRLDDRTYADLVAEARALIPGIYPEWTNHNPSDPGITLVELFAWLSESLIYRADQIPNRQRLTFVRLLNGPEPTSSLIATATLDDATRAQLLQLVYEPPANAPLEQQEQYWRYQRNPPPTLVEEAVRVTVLGLRQPNRAVTVQDFVTLAHEAAPEATRVLCLPRRDLDAGTEAARTANRPGHVSVLVVPLVFNISEETLAALRASGLAPAILQQLEPLKGQEITGEAAFTNLLRSTLGTALTLELTAQISSLSQLPAPHLADPLRKQIWDYLDERRTLTTHHHVTGPFYVPIKVGLLVARRADARPEQLRAAIGQTIVDFLHPLHGGQDGRGWPFGRDIYVSELYELLEDVAGVDYVPDISIAGACPPGDPYCINAPQLWHDSGDLVGLHLVAHHLPGIQLGQITVTVAAGFVPVRLQLQVTFDPGANPAGVRRAIKAALKRRFDAHSSEINGTRNWAIIRENLQAHDLQPPWDQATLIALSALRNLARVPDVQDVAEITLQADTAWEVRDKLGRSVGIGSRSQELADVQVGID
ncbi:MAG: hypothetical protein HGA19_20185 [Oscillochloris sp.]|nr:hypothetical protein [Oscillochloris sp.]